MSLLYKKPIIKHTSRNNLTLLNYFLDVCFVSAVNKLKVALKKNLKYI